MPPSNRAPQGSVTHPLLLPFYFLLYHQMENFTVYSTSNLSSPFPPLLPILCLLYGKWSSNETIKKKNMDQSHSNGTKQLASPNALQRTKSASGKTTLPCPSGSPSLISLPYSSSLPPPFYLVSCLKLSLFLPLYIPQHYLIPCLFSHLVSDCGIQDKGEPKQN